MPLQALGENLWILLLCGLFLINGLTFCLYGVDKYKAKKKLWRIPEEVLLCCAFAGGGVGAWLGMRAFRHKTRKPRFYIGVPIAILCNIGTIYYLFFYK